ncbi:DNA-directed RNA polymerase, subunit E'' [Candidatus Woesearchaeota archaeon]|nr:DNA-directed RNA polymerase, subunit E'' [Candidatus Woesearchaeota archaeon]
MKKVCKNCKMFVTGDVCPNCKSNQFTTNWKGKIVILNPEKSIIAEKIGVKLKGEYAIKVR